MTACPWCASKVPPVENISARDPDGAHRRRNPLRCPECDGVGGLEDWGFMEDPALQAAVDECNALGKDIEQHLNEMRQPHPQQAAIDAEAAALLTRRS